MKKQMNPIWYMVIGILVLIIPTAIYLGFLIPRLTEEYIILMSSAGFLGGAGLFGTSQIPEKVKFGTLYKTASKATTLLVVITLVKEFIGQLIGLAVVLVVSYIIFMIMRSLYVSRKQARANKQLAEEVARSVAEATK